MQLQPGFRRMLFAAASCLTLFVSAATVLPADATTANAVVKRPAGNSVKHKAARRASPYRYANIAPARSDYIDQTDGASRWARGKTIHVYVSPGKANGRDMVARAFDRWSSASGGRIRWTMVDSPHRADYTVGWTSRQRELSAGTEAGTTTTDSYFDSRAGVEIIDRARTQILTRMNGRILSDKQIAETVLHEIGHGLGIQGHSSNPSDIMYYAVSSRQTGRLTGRDANTIARLYAF